MIGSGRAAAVLVAAFTALAALTACAKVATDDSVEEQIKSQLGTDSSDCPTDLQGEQGQSIVCKAMKGAEAFDVKVTVTSVAGDTINFTIERVGGPPAVVTPTGDPMTLMIFAAPMLGLYTLSIAIAFIVGPKRLKDSEAGANS